ncbi:MAG: O-antigen ligase domain-containing protein [Planctomycetota bacterium]|nr:MAG: O-antigen ligase domain-containing protein [Planctomycetota bacterium]
MRATVVVGAALVLAVRALALRWRRASDVGWSRGERLALAGVGAALAVAAAQLVPLPHGLVALLAPATGALHARDAAAAGSLPGWRPLSLEPVATLRALLLGLAYLGTFLAAHAAGRRPRLAAALALGIAGVGAAASLYALLRTAGLPQGDPWERRPRAPFVNPNHLCTFLLLCLGPGVGLLLAPESADRGRRAPRGPAVGRRGAAGLAVLLLVVGIFLSQSRAGVLAAGVCAVGTLALSGALFVAAPWPGASWRRRVRWRLLGAAAAGGVLGLGVLLADVDPLLHRLEHAEVGWEGRLRLWRIAARVIGGHPLGGAGLATFDDASLAVLSPEEELRRRPGSAHNDYLELAADLGVPAAALALAGLGALLLGAVRRGRDLAPDARCLNAGFLGGVLGALAHATCEFALQIPGPALLFATCLGLSAGLTARTERRGRAGARRRLSFRLALAAPLLLCGLGFALSAFREADAAAAHAALRAPGLSPELRAGLAKRAVPLFRRACGALSPALLYQKASSACYGLTACRAGAAVALCILDGAGHLTYPNPDGVPVAELIWTFFSAFSLP